MAEIASIICQCLTYLEPLACDCLDRHVNFEKNLADLRKKVEELSAKLPSEDCPEEYSSNQLQDWFGEVRTICEEMKKLEFKVSQVSYFLRCSLGRDVRRLIENVDKIFNRKLPDGCGQANRATLPTKELEIDHAVKKEILRYLTNYEFGMIGVYGKEGVGKTIMNYIEFELLKQSTFDDVIPFTASDPFNVKELQQRIARKMGGLAVNGDNEQVHASSLKDMMGRVTYALILDNVSGSFNLDRIGIPKPTTNNKCKVVIISESLNVCSHMGCKVVHVGRISEQESLNLFLNEAGLEMPQISEDLKRILILIVNMCVVSPLAVLATAATMKDVNAITDWKTAWNELRPRETAHTAGGSHDQILEILKFSYARLKDSKTKNCLLSCSLYPEDCAISIKDLVGYWMDMGLLEELETRQEMYEEGHRILDTLVNKYQLETRGLPPGSVKMPGPIRNMALHIKRSDSRFMVEAGLQLMEMPEANKWTDDLEEVSLMNNKISEIALNMPPECPKLSALMLQGNDSLKKIPENFFEKMPCLKFLDLSTTAIEALPTSICRLGELTSLLLRGCGNLKNMPSLANLRALKKLDLWDAGIEVVPEDIEKLKSLQYLDLYCSNLKELKTAIFNKLSCLQHLVVYWKSESLKISGSEVAELGKLEKFEGQLYNLQDFNNYVKSTAFRRPSNYMLAVGPDLRCWKFKEDRSKRVSITGCEIGEENFLELPDDVQELNIRECNNVRSLTDGSISLQNNISLRSCGIENCTGIKGVVDKFSSSSSFINNLEDLKLSILNNLLVLVNVNEAEAASMSCAPTLPHIFSNLKTFEIMRCPQMKMLFPFELLQGLRSLQDVRVKDCIKMEEIIGSQVDENQTSDAAARFTTLQELSQLHLVELPKLKKICPGGGQMVCDSLKTITIEKCPKLERFPIFVLGNGQPISSDYAHLEIRLDSEKLLELMKRNNPNSKNLVKVCVNYKWRPLSELPEDFFQRKEPHAIGRHGSYF